MSAREKLQLLTLPLSVAPGFTVFRSTSASRDFVCFHRIILHAFRVFFARDYNERCLQSIQMPKRSRLVIWLDSGCKVCTNTNMLTRNTLHRAHNFVSTNLQYECLAYTEILWQEVIRSPFPLSATTLTRKLKYVLSTTNRLLP